MKKFKPHFIYDWVLRYQYRYFSDVRLATKMYPNLKLFASFLSDMAARGKTGLVSWKKYGDWLEPGKVPSLNIIGQSASPCLRLPVCISLSGAYFNTPPVLCTALLSCAPRTMLCLPILCPTHHVVAPGYLLLLPGQTHP